jgi:hypothetical protein
MFGNRFAIGRVLLVKSCPGTSSRKDADMTKTAKFLGIATCVALALGIAACNKTPAEKQVDAQAEAIDKSYEADAALTEGAAKGTTAEDQAEQQADALRDKGEAVKDHLKNEADELHDDTKGMPNKADQNPK